MAENFTISLKSKKTVHIHKIDNKKNHFTVILTYIISKIFLN